MLNQLKLLALKNLFVKNYARMWPFFKPYWWVALLGVGLTMIVGASDAAYPAFLGIFIDKIAPGTTKGFIDKLPALKALFNVLNIENNRDFAKIAPFMILGFTFVVGALTYVANCVNTWVGSRVTMDIKKRLYRKLLDMNPAYFDTSTSGNVLFRYNNDAESAAAGLIDNLKMFLTRLSSSVGYIAMLLCASWQLAIIAIIVLLLVFIPLAMVRKRMKYIMGKAVASMTAVITTYNETFAGNKTIAAYNLQDYQKRKFDDIIGGVFKFAIKMVRNTNWLSPVMHFIASIGIALVIGVGGRMIVNNHISPGEFAGFVGALILLYTPIKGIGNNFVSLQMSFIAIERLYGILELRPAVADADHARELTAVRRDIEFRNVCFEYNPGVPVLKNVNLSAKVGEMIALVGNSGGGKTTVVNLLPRFYNLKSGGIFIDGVDTREYTLRSLRHHIGVVFQDNFLFSGTIRENIMLGNPAADDAALRRALQHAHLSSFIARLKNGVDAEIGERGVQLSGGQKQRVAIARAFLKDAPILILDEATSALDNKSEAVVQAAINDLMQGRTVFVIAHRLSTVQNADKIVVLNEGQIVEQGKHDELLARGGVYTSLYNAQFKTAG
jgi:subfamily B ATP-binding cassette protein MsbA